MSAPAPLHPSLPPKPTTAGPDHSLRSPPLAQPEASTSKVPLCAICVVQLAKYTCPGCAMRTCSVACAGSHKRKTGCTGERDRAKYVPMIEYTWGKMMEDYTFLEDMGRKVENWGKEIVKGGYMNGVSLADRGRAGGRGRGRGRGGSSAGPGKTKRDILKSQLLAKDIDMDMLSVGMERRKLNQSTWDFRNQTALLTIELKFHKPKDPLAPSSSPREPPFTILTHKNNMQSSLLSIIRSHIHLYNSSKKDNICPEWVKRLVYPDPDDPESFATPQCVMAARLDPLSIRDRRKTTVSHSLDPNQPLAKALCFTEFVEFPTIEVWDEYAGTIVDAGGIIQQRSDEYAVKRRKLNPKAGKATITGLLGDYGSDDDDESQEPPKPVNVLDMLGSYADSDDEKSSIGDMKEENVEMDDVTLAASHEDDDDVQVDPAVLLELLRAAGGDVISLEGKNAAQDWEDADGEELE